MSAMIEAADLVREFGSLRAVDGVSFSVKAGAIFGFLGPNGAGKTTTIKMLTTVLRPTSGSVRIAGHDAARDPLAARRAFGIVFQDSSVDNELTAYENLEVHGVLYGVPQPARRENIRRLLEFVELADRKDDLVKGFSGGMIRRLEIARALLHEPRILFLDEPTAGLDPQTRNRMWDFIRQASRERGTTVFFTTHYMEEAEKAADEVAIVDRGKLIARGSPEAIKGGRRTLEEAFIALTGRDIRDDDAPANGMRQMARLWGRKV
jgi:ABC-2 type transport system ATP-binding protein